jgi:hypothetical protein
MGAGWAGADGGTCWIAGAWTGVAERAAEVVEAGGPERQSFAPSNTPPPPAATRSASNPTTGTCTLKNSPELPLGSAAAPEGAGIWMAGIGAEVIRVAA